MASKGRILITSGIYPPDLGGPAQYAFELAKEWREEGYKVTVKYFSFEKSLPSGIRHIFFFLKILWGVSMADHILTLDTWSAALPTKWACSLLGKTYTIRTGGDFLWESYTERTKKKVFFSSFYSPLPDDLTFKEKWIFTTTKEILKAAKTIVFSTDWQRSVWQLPYEIDFGKIAIVENFYGDKLFSPEIEGKIFVGATRPLFWKNIGMLKDVFSDYDISSLGTVLDLSPRKHDEFIERMRSAYAVILVSLGDISPNMILDAIRCGKPFIVTKEIGIAERIKDIALFVDPTSKEDIKRNVMWLLDENNYRAQREKIANFTFTHTWKDIAAEFMSIMQRP